MLSAPKIPLGIPAGNRRDVAAVGVRLESWDLPLHGRLRERLVTSTWRAPHMYGWQRCMTAIRPTTSHGEVARFTSFDEVHVRVLTPISPHATRASNSRRATQPSRVPLHARAAKQGDAAHSPRHTRRTRSEAHVGTLHVGTLTFSLVALAGCSKIGQVGRHFGSRDRARGGNAHRRTGGAPKRDALIMSATVIESIARVNESRFRRAPRRSIWRARP